jgi:hypothetical protein
MMKRLKFFRLISVLIILALVLAVKAGFISDAWARPPFSETKTSSGYAKLDDTPGYLIQSDGSGQYIDKYIRKANGEDYISITTNKTTGNYIKSFTCLGIVERQSTRRVKFLFDMADRTPLVENSAVFDILIWKNSDKITRRGNYHEAENKWYLDDGTVHFRVVNDTINSTNDNVAFIIDPGWDGTSPNAITQTTVNAFYGNDDNEDYECSVNGHVIYYLDYPSGITAVGANPIWTFTPSDGPTGPTLYVNKVVTGGYIRVNLATYGALPFSLTISLNSIP